MMADEGDFPVVMAAVKHGRLDVTEQLLLAGQDPNTPRRRTAETAMHWAAATNSAAAIRTLLAHGADPGRQNVRGCTPLHWAAQHSSMEAAQLLLQVSSGSTYVQDVAGMTPLDHALEADCAEMIAILQAQAVEDMDDVFSDSQSPKELWRNSPPKGDAGDAATPEQLLSRSSGPTVGRKSQIQPSTSPLPRLHMKSASDGGPVIPAPPPRHSARSATTVNMPSKEGSNWVQYNLASDTNLGHELYPTSVLRLHLPKWCVGRLLRHVTVVQRAAGSSTTDTSKYGAYNRVRAWGCSLSRHSFPQRRDSAPKPSSRKVEIGSAVLLHGLAAKELNGLLGEVIGRSKDGRQLRIQVCRGADRTNFFVKGNNCRIINRNARWWDYRNRVTGYDPNTGIFAPQRSEKDPVQAAFHDWNVNVGMLYAAMIEVEGRGKSEVSFSLVHEVRVEFFPSNYTIVNTDLQLDLDPINFINVDEALRTTSPSSGSSAQVDETEGGGATLLHWAAWKDDVSAAVALLDKDPSAIAGVNEAGSSPLHWAAKQDSYSVAELLLHAGADPKATNLAGTSSLDIVETRGNVEMIQLFRTYCNGDRENLELGVKKSELTVDDLMAEMLGGGLGIDDMTNREVKPHSQSDSNLSVPAQASPHDTDSDLEVTARRVVICKTADEKIGFRLHSTKSGSGTRITGIVPGSPADRAQGLQDGDLILSIQDAPATKLSHENVVAALKAAGNEVHLVVIDPQVLQVELLRRQAAFMAGKSDQRRSIQDELRAQLRRFDVQNGLDDTFPVGAPLPIETLLHPDSESATTVRYDVSDVALSRSQHLRIELPPWASTRILRHISIVHRNAAIDGLAVTHGKDGCLYDALHASGDRITVWGAQLSSESLEPSEMIDRVVVWTDQVNSKASGMLAAVVSAAGGSDELQIRRLGQSSYATVRSDRVKVIDGTGAQWWDYSNADLKYDPGVGLPLPVTHSTAPIEHSLRDWHAHVAPLLAGAIDIVGTGALSVISAVEVEFFPQNVPVHANSRLIVPSEELFFDRAYFPPVKNGADGLARMRYVMSANDIADEGFSDVQLGAGWINDGSEYRTPVALDAASPDGAFIDDCGVLHVPFPPGHHIIGFEVACTEASSYKVDSSPCRVWVNLSCGSIIPLISSAEIPHDLVVSGGPMEQDFVALHGDELLVGTNGAPACLLGYRILSHEADQSLLSLNELRRAKRIEARDFEALVTRRQSEIRLANLNFNVAALRFNESDSRFHGCGSFGPLFAGSYRQQPCVLQIASRLAGELDETLRVDFARDVSLLSTFSQHQNIARIIGFYGSEPNSTVIQDMNVSVCILIEWCENGSLRNFLDTNELLSKGDQLTVLRGVSSGIDYLHHRKPAPIIHGDLRAANVLLKEDFTPCITDFGYSRWKERTVDRSMTAPGQEPAPVAAAWAAPELWTAINETRTIATDIYAFGMLMYEVISGQYPWADLPTEDIYDSIIAGRRPTLIVDTESCDPVLVKVISWCWEGNPGCRPTTMLTVTSILHELAQSDTLLVRTDEEHTPIEPLVRISQRLCHEDLPWTQLSGNTRAVQILGTDDAAAEPWAKALFQHCEKWCGSEPFSSALLSDSLAAEIAIRAKMQQLEMNPGHSLGIGRVQVGDMEIDNRRALATWREAVANLLDDSSRFKCAMRARGATSGDVRVYTVFVVVSQSVETILAEGFGYSSLCTHFGNGAHAFFTSAHAWAAATPGDSVVAAQAVVRHIFPVTSNEAPGQPGSLLGKDILVGYDAHMAYCYSPISWIPVPTGLWSTTSPVALLIVRPDCIFPFAAFTRDLVQQE